MFYGQNLQQDRVLYSPQAINIKDGLNQLDIGGHQVKRNSFMRDGRSHSVFINGN